MLRGTGLGEYGPGETVNFDAEEFVMRRLRQLERSGLLDKPTDWCWCLISLLARIRFCGILSLCQFALPSMADQALIVP